MVTLEQSKLAAQVEPGDLKAMADLAREQHFPAGTEIFKQGQAGDGIYVVKDGLVEISVDVGHDMRQVFSRVEPGDFFGEMAVLEDKARSANAVARADTTVYFLPRADVIRLVETSPALAMTLLREISNRLRQFNGQYLREVLQAERLAVVGRFARSIIHDLKNPLNNIGLTAEIAGMNQLDPTAREQAVATIRHQVDRINEMVTEILEFTQGVPQELVMPPLDFGSFMRELLDEIRAEVALKQVELEVKDPAPEVSVMVNPKRLRRVFNNLVQNASEAMPEGGKIFVRFSLRAGEVVTELEDTGPGVAPEMSGQLFQAFATHGKMHGTGLGLSICKRILEDHHGWITSKTAPGKGAMFQFGIPLEPEADT